LKCAQQELFFVTGMVSGIGLTKSHLPGQSSSRTAILEFTVMCHNYVFVLNTHCYYLESLREILSALPLT